jgi:hypothetical protein
MTTLICMRFSWIRVWPVASLPRLPDLRGTDLHSLIARLRPSGSQRNWNLHQATSRMPTSLFGRGSSLAGGCHLLLTVGQECNRAKANTLVNLRLCLDSGLLYAAAWLHASLSTVLSNSNVAEILTTPKRHKAALCKAAFDAVASSWKSKRHCWWHSSKQSRYSRTSLVRLHALNGFRCSNDISHGY